MGCINLLTYYDIKKVFISFDKILFILMKILLNSYGYVILIAQFGMGILVMMRREVWRLFHTRRLIPLEKM